MNIYLPIAEISVNMFLLLGMGGAVGFLSGMFGVGGGFLMTPLLIFIGIPPTVAVATEANQIVASSVSGVIAHTRRKNVDFKMGFMLLIGGVIGSTSGVWLFSALKASGQIDLVIKLSYVIFLSIIGLLMFLKAHAHSFDCVVVTIPQGRHTNAKIIQAGNINCRLKCGFAVQNFISVRYYPLVSALLLVF